MTALCPVPGSARQLSPLGGHARTDLKFEQRTTDKVFESSGTLAGGDGAERQGVNPASTVAPQGGLGAVGWQSVQPEETILHVTSQRLPIYG